MFQSLLEAMRNNVVNSPNLTQCLTSPPSCTLLRLRVGPRSKAKTVIFAVGIVAVFGILCIGTIVLVFAQPNSKNRG